MRLRLFHRRLTISAPRMAVRSAMPWPLRWAALAIMLGFCGAIALWAFEFGKDIAGLDGFDGQEVARLQAEAQQLRQQVSALQQERDRAQSVANTSSTLLTTEKTAQERLAVQLRQLESENQALRDDLAFFERLIPAGGGSGLAIRSLQADLLNDNQLRWQVLVIQPQKNASEFNGALEVRLSGTRGGQPWSVNLTPTPRILKLRQYGRVEGVYDLPPQTVVKSMTAKVQEGATTRATQSIKLSVAVP